MTNHLFLGKVKILSRQSSNNTLIDAERAILIDTDTSYIYKLSNSLSLSGIYSALTREKNTVDAYTLQKPQTQFTIEQDMEVIVVDSKDAGIQEYLKHLNIQTNKESHICVIAKSKGEYMIPFLFQTETDRIKFCEAFRVYQLNKKLKLLVQNNINHQLINSLCRGASSGNLCIDPNEFSVDNEAQEIKLTITALREGNKYFSKSTQPYSCTFAFKIIDQESTNYFVRFASTIEENIRKIILSNCELNDRIFLSSLNKLSFNSLQEVDLSHNTLTDISFRSLIILLQHSQNLHILNLQHNGYTLTATNLILQFLQATTYFLQLNFDNNKIYSTQFIKEYIVYAQNPPIKTLTLKNNKIADKQKIQLMKQIEQVQCSVFIDLGSIVLADKSSHNYISKSYFQREGKPNDGSLSLKLNINQQPLNPPAFLLNEQQGQNKEEQQQQLSQEQLQKILKQLQQAYQNLDYHDVAVLTKQLSKSPASEQILKGQTYVQYRKAMKKNQQQLINDMDRVLNIQTSQDTINKKLDDNIRKLLRRRVQGQTVDLLIYTKWLRDNKIQLYLKQHYDPMQQIFIMQLSNCFSYYQQERSKTHSFIEEDYMELWKYSNQQYINLMKKRMNEIQPQLRYSYLLKEKGNVKDISQINNTLQELKLWPCKLYKHINITQYPKHRLRYAPSPSFIQNIIDFIATYDIEKFPFSPSVRDAGIIGNEGLMHPNPINIQLMTNHAQVVTNFTKFLYHSPNQYSNQTIQYLQYIIKSVQQQNQTMQLVMGQQYYMHLMSFTNSIPLGKGILSSLIQFSSLYLRHSLQIQPYIQTHLIKNDTYPIQSIMLNRHNEQRITYMLSSRYFGQALNNHGNITIPIRIVGKQQQIPLTIHHVTSIHNIYQLLVNKYQLSIQEYWMYAQIKDTMQLILLSPFQSIGYVLSKLQEQDKIVLKRVIYTPNIWSYQLMYDSLSWQNWLQLYKEVKYNYKYYGSLQMEAQTYEDTIVNCLLCQIVLSGTIEQEEVCNVYIQKIQEYLPYNTTSLSVDSKLKILLGLKQKIGKIIQMQIKYQACIFTFIRSCGTINYACPITVSDSFTTSLTNQLIITSVGLIWVHKTIYVDKVRWEHIYDMYSQNNKIVVIFAKISNNGEHLQYHERIQIQAQPSSDLNTKQLFCSLSQLMIGKYAQIRLRTHLQLLYRFTDEGAILQKSLQQVTVSNCYQPSPIKQSLFYRVCNTQKTQNTVIKVTKPVEKQKQKQEQQVRKREQSIINIAIQTILQQAQQEQKNEEQFRITTNVRRSGRRQLPRRRSSRDR